MNVKEAITSFVTLFVISFIAIMIIKYVFDANITIIASLVLAAIIGIIYVIVGVLKRVLPEYLKNRAKNKTTQKVATKADDVLGDIKKLDRIDVALVKLSVFFFTLFLLKIIPSLMNLVSNIKWWLFLVLFIVAAIRPVYRAYR